MRSIQRAAVCVAVMSSAAAHLQAGTIQIALTARVSVAPEGLRAELEIRNQGDEGAQSVSPALEFRGAVVTGPVIPVLKEGTGETQTLPIAVAGMERLRGVWPVLVRVAYADANNHPFEALHVTTVRIGPPAGDTGGPGLEVALSGLRLRTSGEIVARVESARAATNVRVRFVPATGLAIAPREATIDLRPAKAARVTATVTTAGATPASRLPVVALVEDEGLDGHRTALATSLVEVATGGTSRWGDRILLVILVGLVATWVVLAFRRQRSSGDVS